MVVVFKKYQNILYRAYKPTLCTADKINELSVDSESQSSPHIPNSFHKYPHQFILYT